MERETVENPAYLTEQVITYIGNKRSLLSFIGRGIEIVKDRLGKRKLSMLDLFSGSGIVSRFFKRYACKLIANDFEKYSEIINRCYLSNLSQLDLAGLKSAYNELRYKLENNPLVSGFITELYAPEDDTNIKVGERVFYTRRNAMYLDTARQYIEELPESMRVFFLAPLLSEASVHANTAGVFKGFYKDSSGVGKFGGRKGDALERIMGNIELKFPVFSNFECEYFVFREDANELIENLEEVDIAYIDPPYNQHPYGSNYFMLNLIVDYKPPDSISRVSGIPLGWKRSIYNKKPHAYNALSHLVENIKSKYLLISFNSEGFIPAEDMLSLLNKIGTVNILQTRYNTFRGSRNLRNRNIHVTEYLYLVEKS